MDEAAGAILVVDSGSSSVKFALFDVTSLMSRRCSGSAEGIGTAQPRLMSSKCGLVDVREAGLPDHGTALAFILSHIEEDLRRDGSRLLAVGHRILHGGPNCDCPLPIDLLLEEMLRELIPLEPLHLPHNLAGVAAIRAHRPKLLQVACFDTAFHQSLPPVAKLTGLPREYDARGVRRYGFHGLSYEFIVEALRASGEMATRRRTVIAHLGNGASMCAVRDGLSVETTMGFSTLGGLVMETRCGDLDPGAVLYLMQHERLQASAIEELLYRRSGLLGTSGGLSGDMRELLAFHDRVEAHEAVELFCYRARLQLGALTASLGGLDRLVFTGGIGAHVPEIRARICRGLEHLGVRLDEARNQSGATEISPAWADVVVQVIPTDEELMIARHTYRIAEMYDDTEGAA